MHLLYVKHSMLNNANSHLFPLTNKFYVTMSTFIVNIWIFIALFSFSFNFSSDYILHMLMLKLTQT
jgi:hypothetical protein